MRFRQKVGWVLCAWCICTWPSLPLFAQTGVDPVETAAVDPLGAVKEIWQDLTGADFVVGSSGMSLIQELPDNRWMVGVFDGSLDDPGVALITYTEAGTAPYPLSLMEGVDGAALTAGVLSNEEGTEVIVVGLRAEISPELILLDEGPNGFIAEPFFPLARFSDVEWALAAMADLSEALLAAADELDEPAPDEPGSSGGGGPQMGMEPRRQPRIGTTPQPTPQHCAQQEVLCRQACLNDFRGEVVACAAATATCLGAKCAGITAGCTIFGTVFGYFGCAMVCAAICMAIGAICIAGFAYRLAACQGRCQVSHMSCDPTWTPPQFRMTCIPDCQE